MKRLKVLHVCTSRSWGGMEMIVCRLAQLQKEHGYELTFACDPESHINETCRSNNVRTLDIKDRDLFNLSGIAALDRFISREQPDILHVQYSKDLNLVVPANWRHRKKVILTKQIESVVVKKDPWHRILYSGVNRATGISVMIRDNLIRTTPLTSGQVDLIHLGVDIDQFKQDARARAETRLEMGIAGDRLAIGMMGRMSPGKGFDDFLEMASQLKDDRLFFALIGGYSRNEESYGRSLEEKARRLIGSNVYLTGYKENRQRYLNALDIFIFPSHAESFGLALVEAMATGLPCVAFGKDGVLDIITDGADGLFARVRDAADLKTKTEKLIADPGLRNKLGAAARDKAVSMFSEEKMLAGIAETYHRALA
ncbi:MAG: glycosyltransferase family 4 protein [Candidatus Edwardsbacteria bacterium]|nr:glycosyltransferase family 4 protein [Candidatus Edwardsbacteria bacterium]